ncbi:hypothetical protein E4K67_03215 [Desulfosporosinus fructosivorans]|uniref:Uncharacterized protein n=1 Tax=Desulfosporosinus fructosivorans TaxID=2018669 RepID=A0A4Z0RF69_9FIRM|nr:hypothetical protein [Desulfosporosinus fructosivorans]TGE40236.1 hypothetical protein E4K67_03215 [Desulfosporosinus fructosivorans]
MTFKKEVYQKWVLILSLVTAIIVVFLSWINAVKTFELIVRAGVSFGVMYILMAGSLSLFERTALQEPQDSPLDSAAVYGGNIDFSVGDDQPLASEVQEERIAGQVDRDLSSGLPSSERQADIVRSMGWDKETFKKLDK